MAKVFTSAVVKITATQQEQVVIMDYEELTQTPEREIEKQLKSKGYVETDYTFSFINSKLVDITAAQSAVETYLGAGWSTGLDASTVQYYV